MTTMRIVATEPELQGPFVIIEEADYDPTIHRPYDEEMPKPRAAPASVKVSAEGAAAENKE